MREPIQNLITKDVVDTLKTLSQSGGYWTTADVRTPKPGEGFAISGGRVLVTQGDPAKLPDDEVPVGLTGWRQPYSIICDVAVPDDDVDGIDANLNRIRADAELVLCTEGTSSRRGGFAIDTIVQDPEYAPIEDGSHVGRVTVNVDVIYRTLERDPYTQNTD